MRKWIPLLLAASVATSCATFRPHIDLNQIRSFRQGVTTSEEIKTFLGTPNEVHRFENKLIWYYTDQDIEIFGNILLPSTKYYDIKRKVRLTFDSKKKLINAITSEEMFLHSNAEVLRNPVIVGFDFNQRDLTQFKIGVTTLENVESVLGKAQTKEWKLNGEQTLSYIKRTIMKRIRRDYIRERKLTFFFSSNSILTSKVCEPSMGPPGHSCGL